MHGDAEEAGQRQAGEQRKGDGQQAPERTTRVASGLTSFISATDSGQLHGDRPVAAKATR
jgi:hypothetical protein